MLKRSREEIDDEEGDCSTTFLKYDSGRTRNPNAYLADEGLAYPLVRCLERAKDAAKEARRVVDELRVEWTRVTCRDTFRKRTHKGSSVSSSYEKYDGPYLNPVRANITLLFGDDCGLPDSFRVEKDPDSGDSYLDILPLPVTMKLFFEILEVTKEAHKILNQPIRLYPRNDKMASIHRFIGAMGIGKSYAILAVLLASLCSEENDAAAICVGFDIHSIIQNPGIFIEQLVLMLHRIDGTELVNTLKPIYEAACKIGCLEKARSLVFDALFECRRHCEQRGIPFIFILDGANLLYDQRMDMGHLKDNIIQGRAATMTIVTDTSSVPPMPSDPFEVQPISSPIMIHDVPRDVISGWAFAYSFYRMLTRRNYQSPENQAYWNLWLTSMGSEEKVFKFIEAHSHGVYVMIHDLIEYCHSSDPDQRFSGNAVPYYKFFNVLPSHRRFCSSIQHNVLKSIHKKLVDCVDYYEDCPEDVVREIGQDLWNELAEELYIDDKKALRTLLLKVMDTRLMTIEIDEVPKSVGGCASIILSLGDE